MKRFVLLVLLVSLFCVPAQKARAGTFGDAALSVGIGTLAGGLLGASTLPFYPVPKAHTENIYFGAAMGAIIGVVVASYAGFPEDSEIEDINNEEEEGQTLLQQKSTVSIAKLAPEITPSALRAHSLDVIGQPLAQANFTLVRW